MIFLPIPRRLTCICASLLALFVALTLSPAGAQETRENFDDWTKLCTTTQTGATECLVFQNVTSKDTGRTVLHITALKIPEAVRPVMVITVPLGVYLPPGLDMTVDGGAPFKVGIQICGPEGCQSQFEMPLALFDAFKAGLNGNVAMLDPEGRSVSVPFSLKGFTSAINSLN